MDKVLLDERAKRLYEAKLRTGLYDHYPQYALDVLWEDCVRQTAISIQLEERWDNRGKAD